MDLYPRSRRIPSRLENIVAVFEKSTEGICSSNHKLSSNQVLKVLEQDLVQIGFEIERSKKVADKIKIPVLFGEYGKVNLGFEADGYCSEGKIVIEVEAGRAVSNYQFLKDLFQACMMVDVEYLCIAVRNNYRENDDYRKVCSFLEALYTSNRLKLPLLGILIIGY